VSLPKILRVKESNETMCLVITIFGNVKSNMAAHLSSCNSLSTLSRVTNLVSLLMFYGSRNQIKRFSKSDSLLLNSTTTDPCCYGNEVWDKIGYNMACVGDISEILASYRVDLWNNTKLSQIPQRPDNLIFNLPSCYSLSTLSRVKNLVSLPVFSVKKSNETIFENDIFSRPYF